MWTYWWAALAAAAVVAPPDRGCPPTRGGVMAHCVISAVYDTDIDQMMPACVVHAAFAPCPRNGEPASTFPLHSDDGQRGRRAAVQFWELRTHRQRMLVLHHGSLGGERDHAVGADDWTCWCQPEILAPSGDVYPLAVQG